MLSAKTMPTSSGAAGAKVEVPKIEADGEIDMSDHKLDAELEKEVKDMELSMAQRVAAGDGSKKQLAAVATKVKSGEQTMTRQMRAQRWLNSHGMNKMGSILGGHAARKAVAPKAVESKASTQEIVVDMDDDD